MLQNESQSDQTPSQVGQIRIKPEELTSAVAAIERRKQEEAARLSATIPIEQAVTDLHLDSTPEEIWAEVQAQRTHEAEAAAAAQQAAQQATERKSQTREQFQPPLRFKKRSGIRQPLRAIAFFGTLIWILNASGALSHPHRITLSTSAPVPTPATSSMPTLATVPDGQEVYCTTSTLVQISEAKPLTTVHVSTSSEFDNSWTLVKMRGHVYLHAYTMKSDSLQALKGNTIQVFNEDNSGALEGNRTSKITLRVDNVPLQVSGGDDDYSEVTIPNFKSDDLTTISEWH